MVRMTLKAPTPGPFYAKVHGLVFLGDTPESVFAQIDKFEEDRDLRASSYFVYDMIADGFPGGVLAYANTPETRAAVGWDRFPEYCAGDPALDACVHDPKNGTFAFMRLGR